MHLKDRSIITNIMPIPEKTIKIVYLNYKNRSVRCVEINIKNKTQYFADNTKEFEKKWNRYILKHYLITDYLQLKEKRNKDRKEHLNCFRESSFNKTEIYNQYRKFISSKLKTNFLKLCH